MFQFRFCRHCAERSENFLTATIKSKRTCESAQYVIAPAIPFAIPDKLRFLPRNSLGACPRFRSATSRVSEVQANQQHPRDESAADHAKPFKDPNDFIAALARFDVSQ